jgi:hypothetical protein
MSYENMAAIKNELLNADGSRQTFSGEVTASASEAGAALYRSMSPIKNEMINPDGSTSPLPSGGGGGGFNPTTIAGYDSTKTQYLSHDADGVAQWVEATGGGADVMGQRAIYSSIIY